MIRTFNIAEEIMKINYQIFIKKLKKQDKQCDILKEIINDKF